jgi:hypothetical protein
MARYAISTCTRLISPIGTQRSSCCVSGTLPWSSPGTGRGCRYPLASRKYSRRGKTRTWRSISNVAGIAIACHFFTPDDIEFDLSPEQVDSAERFEALLAFLRVIASTLGKTVSLTPENLDGDPILTVDPRTNRVVYHAAPDAPAI